MMKTFPWVLRVYGERRDDQWSVICLDLNLAAQADTLIEAQTKLHSMIKAYVADSLLPDGADREHAAYFLRRRAPLVFWAKYYFAIARNRVFGQRIPCDKRLATSDTLPMVPAGA